MNNCPSRKTNQNASKTVFMLSILIYLHEKIVACIIYTLAVKVWSNKDLYFKYCNIKY